MTNNDILHRLCYALTISNDEMVEMFAKDNLAIDHAQLHGWLMKEAEEGEVQEVGYAACPDSAMSQFLDGLIVTSRGVREDEPPQVVPNRIQKPYPAQAAHRPQLQGIGDARDPQAGELQPIQIRA